ncbi:hypothetical protein C8F04DRAFT_1100699 [Mycena alexandri]|uniref:Uncharacterized protein n=1 Tax=Mycena alexandri TaxID=1745969 RepID=A0AAD6X2Y1_9AGAR|nr:hypothetical protein C8F04DRAFT_1100699 [Mycena alexandri]
MSYPVSQWSNCFALAKAAIEKHVEAHKQYLSDLESVPPTNHVPRLVDLAAQRLAAFSMQQDSLDDIPSVILGMYLWKWHNIAYSAFRRGLLRVPESTSGDPIESIDEWILSNEKWLRDKGGKWQDGLVTLSQADSVFPNSLASPAGRTIQRPDSLPGHEIICAAREPHITIQPSVKAFKNTFARISDGLLKNLNWNNILVAGGIVLGTLLSVDLPDGQPHTDPRWKSSDIDIYIYGLSADEANQKVEHIFKTFCANLPPGTPRLVVRNCTTITLYARYPLRRIQIVLKLVKSPKTVLLNFDLDICAMGWDGHTIWMLPRAARALETGCNVFTMDLIHGHYLSNRRASTSERIFKYADKGYGIRILPSYFSSIAARKLPLTLTDRLGKPREGTLELISLIHEEQEWTVTEATGKAGRPRPVFQNMLPKGYRPTRSLTGLCGFVRSATLWEMGHRGEISLKGNTIWAASEYQDAMTTYDETPRSQYKWDENFNVNALEGYIYAANLSEISAWIETDFNSRLTPHGVEMDCGDDEAELKSFRRMVCAPTVDALLSKKRDLRLQILLPCEFAVYANDLVSQAQVEAGLPKTKLLTPAVRECNFLGNPDPQTDGLFFWRIGKDLMWQQLDCRVDEVFEILYAFRRVNEQLRSGDRRQASLYNEFDAFADWVQGGPRLRYHHFTT